MSSKIIVPAGTEIRKSEIGYYDFWYPSKSGEVLEEDLQARHVTTSDIKCTLQGRWTPLVVSAYDANFYGSPIRVLWIRKKTK